MSDSLTKAAPGRPLDLLRGIGEGLLALPRSLRLCLPLFWAWGLWLLSSTKGAPIEEGRSLALAWVYNTGHAFLFGVLALLCVANLPRQGNWVALTLRRSLLILILVMSYGLLDEWHQSWVPRRSASGLDLLTDLVGAVATLWVIKRLTVHPGEDRNTQVQRLRRALWLGFGLSWLMGLLATLFDQ